MNNSQVSGFAFFEAGNLARAVLINLNAYTGERARGSVTIVPSFEGGDPGCGAPGTMTIKRLNVPCVFFMISLCAAQPVPGSMG